MSKIQHTYIEEDGYISNPISRYLKDDKREDEFAMKKRSVFVKVFTNFKDPDYSTKNFKLYFSYLCKFAKKDSNVLSIGNEVFDHVKIADMLDISISHCDKFLAESVRIGSIARVRVKRRTSFVINPVYAFNGRYINISLYEMFNNSLDFLTSLSNGDKTMIKLEYGDDVDSIIKEKKQEDSNV